MDSKLDVTRSQLVAARIRLRIAEAQGQADVLREHLSSLLGVPAESIATDPQSMPQIPAISQDEDLPARAVDNSPAVKLARAERRGRRRPAPRASTKQRYGRPSIWLRNTLIWPSSTTTICTTRNYQANNFSGGLNLRIPIFNSVQKAKAEEADADAMMAQKQADLTTNQVSEDALKLQRSLRQLSAARDVAKLEWEVSQGDLDAVKARVQTRQGQCP